MVPRGTRARAAKGSWLPGRLQREPHLGKLCPTHPEEALVLFRQDADLHVITLGSFTTKSAGRSAASALPAVGGVAAALGAAAIAAGRRRRIKEPEESEAE